jgi:GT2 family glycosyltransferase
LSGLVVLVPSIEGRPRPECEERLRTLERRGVEVRRVSGYAAIDFARSVMATRALASGFDEILWIDDDIVFDPFDVERMRESGEPLICGAYAKKGKRELALHALAGTDSLTFGAKGSIVEVRYAGTGFMYTRREVYEKIAAELPVCNARFGEPVVPYFLPFVVEDAGEPWYLAEDYAFCERARRAGFKVLVDTRVRLFHVGSYAFGWEDAGGELQRFDEYVFRLR